MKKLFSVFFALSLTSATQIHSSEAACLFDIVKASALWGAGVGYVAFNEYHGKQDIASVIAPLQKVTAIGTGLVVGALSKTAAEIITAEKSELVQSLGAAAAYGTTWLAVRAALKYQRKRYAEITAMEEDLIKKFVAERNAHPSIQPLLHSRPYRLSKGFHNQIPEWLGLS